MYAMFRTKTAVYVFNLKHHSFSSSYDRLMKAEEEIQLSWSTENWKKDIKSRYYGTQDDWGKKNFNNLKIIKVSRKEEEKRLVEGEIISI